VGVVFVCHCVVCSFGFFSVALMAVSTVMFVAVWVVLPHSFGRKGQGCCH